MNTEPTVVSRELSYFESTLQQATMRALSSTIYCWATGTGPVDLEHVRSAMRILHERHPLLRARIDGEPGTYRFVTDVPFDQIPLREIDLAEGEDINSVIEPLMNVLLTGEQRTWGARFVRSRDERRWWVILETHHAITDGRSAFCLLDQCGQLLGTLVTGNDTAMAPHALPDPIEHQLDPPGTMERWKNTGKAWADRIGQISHWPIDGSADFRDRQNRNTFSVHDENFTHRLTESCHAAGTTVQGAFASAVTRGVSAFLNHAVNIDTLTPVDLRRFANVQIDPHEIACKIMCLDTGSFDISSDSDPWQVARDYNAALSDQLHAAHFPPLDFTPEDVTSAIDGWMIADGHHTHGLCLTNTGLLHIDGDYGPVQFEEVDITASTRFGGFPVLLSVYTYRKKLRCTYTWPQPILTHDHALALTQAVESHLRAMVD